jgi:hypothetical protein
MKQLLLETLEKMPVIFSSNQFSKLAQKKGIPKNFVNNGGISDFLRYYAEQCGSRRIWKKNTIENEPKVFIPKLFKSEKNTNKEDAINLLKSLGYKIMKPITQFEEI